MPDPREDAEPDIAPAAEPTSGPPEEPDLRTASDGDDAGESTWSTRYLWSRIARPSGPQRIALILISCLALGPLFALVSILRSDPTPVKVLATQGSPTAGESTLTVTALDLSPSAGELRVRVIVQPGGDLVDDAGEFTENVFLVLNDARGATKHPYRAGETPIPIELTLPVTEGSVVRYPFDKYRGTLFAALTLADSADQTRLPLYFEARSTIDDFTMSAKPVEDADKGSGTVVVLDWEARRPATTTVYAVWLMILMWGLAVTGLLIIWAVIIWMVDVPFWTFGVFVGSLFALPPLRDSLPGSPPPGTLFDFVSFYWSVTIIGVSLILMLAVWIHRSHLEVQLRRLDQNDPTTKRKR